MSNQLKPCPWCGHAPHMTYRPLPYGSCWHIDCENPECKRKPGTWFYYDLSDAVKEWNALEVDG